MELTRAAFLHQHCLAALLLYRKRVEQTRKRERSWGPFHARHHEKQLKRDAVKGLPGRSCERQVVLGSSIAARKNRNERYAVHNVCNRVT
jgi:hypothetical protein